MKKLLFVLITLFCFFLIGCNEKKNNMSADSKENLENVNHEQEKGNDVDSQSDEQNDIDLSNSHIDLNLVDDNNENNDNEFNKSNEELQGDEIVIGEEQLIAQAKQTYLELYLKRNREDAIIDDVWLFNYLGIYNDCIVGVFLDRKNCLFPEYELNIQIENLCFYYSCGYEIMVYKDGSFFSLYEAYYVSKVLNIVEINEIYSQYQMMIEEVFTEENESTDYDFALEIGKVDYPMVSFSIKKYSYSLNSVSGVVFKVDLENVTLECSVDYGSFSYYDNEKKCIFSSFDKIQWCPSFIYDSSLIEEFYFNNVEKAYMDIIIISGNDIIGYVVISLEQLSRTSYLGDVVKSVLFEYDSDNIDVTKEFVLNEIEILKKNLS